MSNVNRLLPKSISCFDPSALLGTGKLSMSGRLTLFQHITIHPEPVEGQMVTLGNSPLKLTVQMNAK